MILELLIYLENIYTGIINFCISVIHGAILLASNLYFIDYILMINYIITDYIITFYQLIAFLNR